MYQDSQGVLHALWRGNPDADTGLAPLLYSRGTIAAPTVWEEASSLTDSVLVWDLAFDINGGLHLAYVRPTNTEQFPAGVYYRQSLDGGATWSDGTLIYASLYMRLQDAAQANVRLAADAAGTLHVVWEEQPTQQSFYSRLIASSIEGWSPAEVLPQPGASRPYVVTTGPGRALRLWQATRGVTGCVIEYQTSEDNGTTWSATARAVESLRACAGEHKGFLLSDEHFLLVNGIDSSPLLLALWDGTQWSESRELEIRLEMAGSNASLPLRTIDLALSPSSDRLGVVGVSPDNEVWFQESPFDPTGWTFAPPPPWSDPVRVSQAEGVVGIPALAMDERGNGHLLWSLSQELSLPGHALRYATWSSNRWAGPLDFRILPLLAPLR